jgi:acetyltransferase-like isoleucine patch superfamily enzyme
MIDRSRFYEHIMPGSDRTEPTGPGAHRARFIDGGHADSRWGRALRRIARSPRTVTCLMMDRIMGPLWLRCLGVQIGTDCVFVGLPIVSIVPGARIALENAVKVFSRFDSNPAGLPHPTIFAALGNDSAIVIGEQTGISGASIVARSAVTIGRRVLIGAGACIWDTDFHPLDPEQRRSHPTDKARSAPIWIDHDVFVGARAMILKGVTIGPGAVIGAGAVVTKNVGTGQIVAGNPARVIGSVPVPA